MAKETDGSFESTDVSQGNRGNIEGESLGASNTMANIIKQAQDLELVDAVGYITVINGLGNKDVITLQQDELAGNIQMLLINGWQLRLSTDNPAYDKKAIMTLPGTAEMFVGYGEVYKATTYWQRPAKVIEATDIHAIAEYIKRLKLDTESMGSEASPAA